MVPKINDFYLSRLHGCGISVENASKPFSLQNFVAPYPA
jgi:hypothetical protein